jgi:hypothetical protein
MSWAGGKGGNVRALSGNEVKLIRSVFQKRSRLPSVMDGITIADGVNFHGGPWTDSDYQINVGKKLFEMDLAVQEPETLVHEMTHVWQYFHGLLTKAHGFKAQLVAGVKDAVHKVAGLERMSRARLPDNGPSAKEELYAYDVNGTWSDMGFEGQANMVEGWFNGGMRTDEPRFLFVDTIIWQDRIAEQYKTRAQLAGLRAPQMFAPLPRPVSLTDSYLIALLQPGSSPADLSGFGPKAKKLEQVFQSTSIAEALPLITRLTLRKSGDKVASLFHDNVPAATRAILLQLLQNRLAGK